MATLGEGMSGLRAFAVTEKVELEVVGENGEGGNFHRSWRHSKGKSHGKQKREERRSCIKVNSGRFRLSVVCDVAAKAIKSWR